MPPRGASFSAIKRFQQTPATASTDSLKMVKKVGYLRKPDDTEKSDVDFDHKNKKYKKLPLNDFLQIK